MLRLKLPFLVLLFCPLVAAPQTDRFGAELTRAEVGDMVANVCQLMLDHYVFPDIADKICDRLRHNQDQGEYDVATYKTLAELLSRDLKSVNQDLHLNVWPIPPDRYNRNTENVDPIVRQLNIMRENAEQSYEFVKVEILEGNIGYLELTRFKSIPDPGLERVLEGAMDFLSCCSAVILDLRRNTGGNDKMIQKFLSYFFEKPVPITGQYTRESGGIKEFFTRDHFHHRYLTDVPLFVLVSSRTVSGPEQVAYDLKALKRAKIVGETTKGAGNPSHFYRIKEKLLVCIPYGYAVNPLTGSNWEGTGVTPDVIVPANSALTVATGLAKEAAGIMKEKEQERVDGLAVKFIDKMRQVEALLKTDAPAAERLFEKTLDEFYEIEYMSQYLLLDWLGSYGALGNDAACEMIAKQGLRRYPEDERFYSRLGDLYKEKGDLEKALQMYSDLLKLNPNDISVKKKIEEIRRHGLSDAELR